MPWKMPERAKPMPLGEKKQFEEQGNEPVLLAPAYVPVGVPGAILQFVRIALQASIEEATKSGLQAVFSWFVF